jgi:competence protein ComEC
VNRRCISLLVLITGLVCISAARVEIYIADWNANNLGSLAHNQKVTVEGIIVADPDRRDTTLHANLRVSKINTVSMHGTLIAFLPPETKLVYGQRVVVKGTLRQPDSFLGDNGNIFDYPHYLQVQGVSAMLTSAVLLSSTPAPVSLKGILYFIKAKFNASLEKIFIVPESALIEGILLGERRGLSPDVTSAFVAAGLIHIVILAGYVLSLVGEGVMRALAFVPKKFRYPLAGLFLILFVVMIGASSTTVRACTMALVSLTARYFNRTSVALRALGFAAIGMAFWNPAIILWDSSFIISALATFGLITFSPVVEHWLRWIPEKFEARSIATSTLSVQIFALPALLYYTGALLPFALPANLLALPVLPWVMLSGFLAGLLNLIPGVAGLVLAFAPAFFCQLLLRWILLIVSIIKTIPDSAATVQQFPGWLTVGIYIPLICFAVFQWRRQNVRSSHPN